MVIIVSLCLCYPKYESKVKSFVFAAKKYLLYHQKDIG